jgi:hypothetical protein
MVAGIEVSQAQATPFGRYLTAQVQLDESTKALLASVGFEPQRDLRELVAASHDLLSEALLAGRGSFHPDRIEAAAARSGATASHYHGVVLIATKLSPDSKSGAIAFLDSSTMLAGDIDAVKAAIDRHAAGRAFSGTLADQARRMSAANDAWLISSASGVNSLPSNATRQLGGFANVLQAAVQVSAGLKFAATRVTLSAEVLARSPQDAQSMADVLRFAIGLLQANQGQGAAPALPSDAADITSSGSVTRVVVALPEQQLEHLFLTRPAPPKHVAQR